jgi:hypothetical protein
MAAFVIVEMFLTGPFDFSSLNELFQSVCLPIF